jgi:hypothetical protein
MAIFDPDRVAHFEAAGWRAYYDRRWLRLFGLMEGLCREQFRIPWPISLWATYNVSRGAAIFAPATHSAQDEARALTYYRRFYTLAQRYSGLAFEPERVARLEMQYWVDHRRLVEQSDKTDLLKTLEALHQEIFGVDQPVAHASAEWRLQAANTVDLITGRRSQDVEGDWARLEDDLRRCYRTILSAR